MEEISAQRSHGSTKSGLQTHCHHQVLIFYNFQLNMYILDEELFTDGTLLGSVRGPAFHTGVVHIEAPSLSPQGHYVIFQKNSTEQEEDRQQLRVAEFVAYGSYDASIEGSINILITLACGRFVRFRSSLTTQLLLSVLTVN